MARKKRKRNPQDGASGWSDGAQSVTWSPRPPAQQPGGVRPPVEDDDGNGDDFSENEYNQWGGSGRDPLADRNIVYDEWANDQDREAAYFRYLRNYLNIDPNGVDSDYTDWIRSQYQTMDEDWRIATGNSYALWNPDEAVGDDEEIVVGSDGKKRRRKKKGADTAGETGGEGLTGPGAFDSDNDGVNDARMPIPPDYWEYLAKNLTAERFGPQANRYQDFWANRNQQQAYQNAMVQRGYDIGGTTRTGYQEWLANDAFRPYEEGFARSRQSNPNLQFRAYLNDVLGATDMSEQGDTYQDWWGDRNQAAKFTNWVRGNGFGQIDNARNPFTAYVQGEGGMGQMQRKWNQGSGGSTWNDFLKDQDPNQFVQGFMRAGRRQQGRSSGAFGAGPGRWSTFGG